MYRPCMSLKTECFQCALIKWVVRMPIYLYITLKAKSGTTEQLLDHSRKPSTWS